MIDSGYKTLIANLGEEGKKDVIENIGSRIHRLDEQVWKAQLLFRPGHVARLKVMSIAKSPMDQLAEFGITWGYHTKTQTDDPAEIKRLKEEFMPDRYIQLTWGELRAAFEVLGDWSEVKQSGLVA